MPRLIVTGNGFDLAHGLRTKYSDFMEYLCSYGNEPEDICGRFGHLGGISRQYREKLDFYKAISKYICKQDLWSSFEEALSRLDDEQLQNDHSCYLLDYGDELWRDSANHDYQRRLREELSFSSDIPYYCGQWIRGIDTSVAPLPIANVINANCVFLNFNYTDTLEAVYGVPEERIMYIHGKAKRGDHLIVGHHNNALFREAPMPRFQSEEEWERFYDNCVDDVRVFEAQEIIKTYFRNTYKDTDSIILQKQLFFRSLTSIDEVYILGHSLSDIDFGYFYAIKEQVPNDCQWNVSYHDMLGQNRANKFLSMLGIRNSFLFQF